MNINLSEPVIRLWNDTRHVEMTFAKFSRSANEKL